MSDLSITNSINVISILSEGGVFEINPSHTESIYETIECSFSLSGMDTATESVKLINTCGFDHSVDISTQLSDLTNNTLSIDNTIGNSSLANTINISTPLTKNNLQGSIDIAFPQATTKLIDDTLTVYADGIEITTKLKKASLTLFGNNKPMSLNASFSFLNSIPTELLISINDIDYNFTTTSSTSSYKGIEIEAESMATSRKKIISYNYQLATDAVAQFGDIIFAGDQFLSASINGSYSSYKFARKLSEASGNYARQLPSNNLIFNTSKSNPTYEPSNILDWIKVEPKKRYSCVEVIYGKRGDDYITIEPSIRKKKIGGQISLRVYGSLGKTLNTNATSLKALQKSITEEITEDVFFENGIGKLSKPANTTLTEGVTATGKRVVSDSSCQMMAVRYLTTYDLYEITSNIASDMTFCVYLENIAYLLTGETGDVKKLVEESICDHTTAINRAKTFLHSEANKTTLVTTHDNIINTTSGLNIKSKYGTGPLIGASIHIDSNPIKITNKLEVLQWQK
ncbi:MAG: hypothetical protein C0603_05640 [Denitrovibrio sp.]|nr:MAG: hypothetical protein C0603_05640 [Denitrovibrio sp.]